MAFSMTLQYVVVLKNVEVGNASILHLFCQPNKGEQMVTVISSSVAQWSGHSLYELIIPPTLASRQKTCVQNKARNTMSMSRWLEIKSQYPSFSHVSCLLALLSISLWTLDEDGIAIQRRYTTLLKESCWTAPWWRYSRKEGYHYVFNWVFSCRLY